jgi:hypothetical protein
MLGTICVPIVRVTMFIALMKRAEIVSKTLVVMLIALMGTEIWSLKRWL